MNKRTGNAILFVGERLGGVMDQHELHRVMRGVLFDGME